jgi:tetratricopeptide (TPR) repeat protein
MSKSKVQRNVAMQKTKGEGKPPQAEVFPLHRHNLTLIISLVLIVATLFVFWQVRNHQFVNLDDGHYIVDNPYVRRGLTLKSVIWAFTTTYASNWHPLTWLSHMVDCGLFGLRPGGHHVTNVLFHIASTLLLFLVLKRMTGDLWKSGFVSALFALHPLHVESVAWAAERKDVLSTFFWMLTMWTYVGYVERPGFNRYLVVLLSFILGLLSKPMLVTLPFVMLLLDYWPLGRLQFGTSSGDRNSSTHISLDCRDQSSPVLQLVLEKVPFFVLSAVSSFVTFFAQKSGGAVQPLEFFPLVTRIVNSLVSYVGYIWKMIWPRHLALLYPYPNRFPIWEVVGASLVLVCISVLATRAARGRPYLLVGWLWYLGTLVPVIGLVQVGMQAMADRYTYVPLIGLFIMVAWGSSDILKGWRYRRVVFAAAASLVVSVLMIVAWVQVRYWENSMALSKHAVEVTVNNYHMHNNLGVALAHQGKMREAMAQYTEALRIHPGLAHVKNNIGSILFREGKIQEAIDYYTEALKIDPNYADAHSNFGVALVREGKIQEAIAHYKEALRIKPDYAEVHNNLGFALARQGKNQDAIDHFSEALRIKPDYVDAFNNLGVALVEQGKKPEEIVDFAKTLGINLYYPDLYNELGVALARQEKNQEAISLFTEALRIKPDHADVHNNLGIILARQGKNEEAIVRFTEALRIKPDYAEAHNNLGIALARQGKIQEAISHHHEALRIKPNLSEAHYSLGVAYLMIGNRDSALEEYKILQTSNPNLANSLSKKIFK